MAMKTQKEPAVRFFSLNVWILIIFYKRQKMQRHQYLDIDSVVFKERSGFLCTVGLF